MKKPTLYVLTILFLSSLLAFGTAGCGIETLISDGATSAVISTATPSPTPDRCAPPNIAAEITRVVHLMNRFDTFSTLAQSSPKEQLAVVAVEMFNIQSDALDLDVPTCLVNLQESQLKFMNSVTGVMANFLNGAASNDLQQQITLSREYRTTYEVELGSLLGYEYHTPTPWPTSTPTPVTPTSTPAAITVSSLKDAKLYRGPGTNYAEVGVILIGKQANVIARSADFTWILIDLWNSPGSAGWVAFVDVKPNSSLLMVPVATALPTPTP